MAPADRRQPPFYIVGLPDEPAEAEDAKLKFERLSVELTRAFPYIEEIRAVVKSKRPIRTHTLYEVSVEVYTPRERHSFTETGHNLAAAFDAMGPKMKRMLSSKPSRVTGTHGDSRRKQDL